MKQDTVLTLNWLRVNFPTIAAIALAGFYVGGKLNDVNTSLAMIDRENVVLKTQVSEFINLPYRVQQLESGLKGTNERVDALSNTLISQLDLIRRDVNRLTTQVEVLSSRVGVLTGDVDEPKQRRARPPAPE